MRGLQGRPAASPSIDEVRELTVEEVRTMPRGRVPARTTALRDTHHLLARLIAMGLRSSEVAERSGYSLTAIGILKADPAFQELIANYREVVTTEFREATDEYFSMAASVRVSAIRLIKDRLDGAEPEDIPLNQLTAIHADLADRTGYPKRRESINLNMDFAERLEAATKRSRAVKQIEGKVELSQSDSNGNAELPVGGSHQPAARPAGIPASDGAGEMAGASEHTSSARPRPSIPKELMPQPRFARRM